MIMRKVINSLFVIIAAMVTFASCAKQEIETPVVESKTVQFFANSIETKTEFGTPDNGVYPTLWSTGDRVKILVNLESVKDTEKTAEIECSEDFRSAKFTSELVQPDAETFTFYSVSPSVALLGKTVEKLYVTIPSDQTPLETSVDKKAQLLFAMSETKETMPSSVELSYHHLTAYGKLSLANLSSEVSSVSKIKIEAPEDMYLTGRWDYFLAEESLVVRSGNGSNTIVLTTSNTTDIWFACAPVDVSGQTFTLTVTTDKGDFVKEITFPANRTFEAGRIAKFTVDMDGIEVDGTDEPEQPGDSEGTTTATLSSDEIKTEIAASKCSYGTEVVYDDTIDAVVWTSTCYTDANSRPWLQMKNDAAVYIAISSDSDIKEVEITVTGASNSSGGVSDITKHTSFSGTLSLNTQADGKGTNVASGSAASNIVTLTPTGSYKKLYLKTSSGARVWNINVKKSVGGENPEPEQPTLTPRNLAFSSTTETATVGQAFTAPTLSGVTTGVTYSSSNPAVATVNTSGVVTLVGAGTTTITATAPATDQYEAGEASYTLTVNPADEGGDDEQGNDPVTVTKSMSSYGFANEQKVTEIQLDDVITANAVGKTNTGKYYTSGSNWRLYQTEEATLTISAKEGYVINSVKVTYSVSNTGILKKGDTQIKSGTTDTVNATSVTYSVGNSGSATNGQVRVTAIEVVYQKN